MCNGRSLFSTYRNHKDAKTSEVLNPVVPITDCSVVLQAVKKFERVQHGLVHVEVLVGSQTTHKSDTLFSLGQFLVFLVKFVIFLVRLWVVGIALVGGIFSNDDGPRVGGAEGRSGLVGRVLVLGYSGEVDFQAWVVDHVSGLVESSIWFQEFALKMVLKICLDF